MSAIRHEYKELEKDPTAEIRVAEIQVAERDDETTVSGLVHRAREGDVGAFGELYGMYLERIYRYVFYQVKNKMIAEDLSEEVFVKAWEALGRQRVRNPVAWLYRIAHNCVIDYFRAQRPQLQLAEKMVDSGCSLEQQVEEKIAQEELAESLSFLPPQQRQVIILKFIEDMDNKEIAQIMRKREGAIRIMQMRALAALRQKLMGEEEKCRLKQLKSSMSV